MMSQTTITHEPIVADDNDASVLHEAACALASATDDAVRLVLPDGTDIDLPKPAVAALRLVVEAMSANQAVLISPVDTRLAPKQAAQMLNVPDDYFELLMENGDIPVTANGKIRLIALTDLIAYKRVRDAQTHDALREMTRLSQEMGFYQPDGRGPGIP